MFFLKVSNFIDSYFSLRHQRARYARLSARKNLQVAFTVVDADEISKVLYY